MNSSRATPHPAPPAPKGPPTAVFSDIHSNLEALEAVLADISKRGIRRMLCLGDIVGYAADPAACLARVRESGAKILRGNHDDAVASDMVAEEVSETAAAGFEFSRSALTREERGFLAGLPMQMRTAGSQFVHASLDDPAAWHYVDCAEEADLHFSRQTTLLAFCGHTHVPMVAYKLEDGIGASQGDGRILLPRICRSLINVGSVGQPRDGNPRACYVIHDPASHTAEFCRVPYDLETTIKKIRKAGLPAFTAQRLKKAS